MERSAPRYQPYRDVPPAPFRWRLGVRPLDLAEWLEVDDHYARDVDAKRRVLAAHHATAFAVVAPDHPARAAVDAASAEALDAIVDHLQRLHPARLDPVRFGSLAGDPTVHPLDAAGRLVQEDLVVLVEHAGELICGAGSVCFPNRWDLRSKIGLPMSAVHAPVARLNAELADPIDAFLARLRPERPFWRLGWGVLDTGELYQAVDGTAPARPSAARRVAPAEHHVRVERETLRRLPATGAVLFTIRTYVTPLTEVPAGSDAETLAAAIEALPPDVAEYKQLAGDGARLARWLRQLATTSDQ